MTEWSEEDKNLYKVISFEDDDKSWYGFKTSNYSAYKECLCSSGSETTYLRILNNLSTSLNYVITDNISGHKNYIHDSLYDWSSTLYEFMQW